MNDPASYAPKRCSQCEGLDAGRSGEEERRSTSARSRSEFHNARRASKEEACCACDDALGRESREGMQAHIRPPRAASSEHWNGRTTSRVRKITFASFVRVLERLIRLTALDTREDGGRTYHMLRRSSMSAQCWQQLDLVVAQVRAGR